MRKRAYTVLGFVAWEGIKVVLGRKVGQNRAKIGAAATVLLVLIGGLAIAKARGGSEESLRRPDS